jgi:putative holliday junction resolvase
MTAPIVSIEDLASLLPARAALIGLDLGTKTIGTAVSDDTRRVAAPLKTLPRNKFGEDAKVLLELVRERKIGAIVIGLPINMDGSEGPRAQASRAFARNLARLTELPIGLWDERLSTAAVERELISQDVSRARRAEVIDAHAAAFILQGALDRLRAILGETTAAEKKKGAEAPFCASAARRSGVMLRPVGIVTIAGAAPVTRAAFVVGRAVVVIIAVVVITILTGCYGSTSGKRADADRGGSARAYAVVTSVMAVVAAVLHLFHRRRIRLAGGRPDIQRPGLSGARQADGQRKGGDSRTRNRF